MQEKQDIKDVPNVKKEGWDAEKIAEEATNEEPDDIVKKIESDGKAEGIPQKDRTPKTPDTRDSNLDKS